MFPAADGISGTMSPQTIVTEQSGAEYNVKCRIKFGAYAQVCTENDLSKTTKSCTTGVIAMNLTGNDQEAFNFMSLSMGKRFMGNEYLIFFCTGF